MPFNLHKGQETLTFRDGSVVEVVSCKPGLEGRTEEAIARTTVGKVEQTKAK